MPMKCETVKKAEPLRKNYGCGPCTFVPDNNQAMQLLFFLKGSALDRHSTHCFMAALPLPPSTVSCCLESRKYFIAQHKNCRIFGSIFLRALSCSFPAGPETILLAHSVWVCLCHYFLHSVQFLIFIFCVHKTISQQNAPQVFSLLK